MGSPPGILNCGRSEVAIREALGHSQTVFEVNLREPQRTLANFRNSQVFLLPVGAEPPRTPTNRRSEPVGGCLRRFAAWRLVPLCGPSAIPLGSTKGNHVLPRWFSASSAHAARAPGQHWGRNARSRPPSPSDHLGQRSCPAETRGRSPRPSLNEREEEEEGKRAKALNCPRERDYAEIRIVGGGPLMSTVGKLDGRVVLITGAARGQGEARRFVAEGASVGPG